ncbi:MAG: orotidine-5'-phosphate decarboxylase, partial [Synergistaceae bacterium]|nr:orotidine-5'-phosphate decarboxylase [Synergistaceae bacterium]
MKRIDRLIKAIGRAGAPVALGLDTRPEYLPDGFARDAGGIRAFNFVLIDALADIVPCVKVQAAVYEALGLPGMEAFRDTLARAAEKGMLTIADVKRNDIGATAEAYAAAYLGSPSGSGLPPFAADFVTVNAYLGADGVSPFLDACEKTGRGVFVLTRTSNPSAGEFQDLTVRGSGGIERPLYEEVGLRV